MLLKKLLLITCLAFIASPAAAAYLTVGCGGDYTTIQAAVNAASNWDTITVCPGDYDESVFIENKEGLTIQSTEIAEKGPNTMVNRFNIGFAPNFGPHSVTIKGFTVNGPSGSPCIESSGDYTTIAFNTVKYCSYGIRVNEGNYANNVHHNDVRYTSLAGITVEGNGGFNHNIHENLVKDVGGEGCYYVWSDYTEVHQNQAVGTCGNGGINANGSDGIHIHHNQLCFNADIALFGADYAFVHHNELTDEITNPTGEDKLLRNRENLSKCPIYN